MKLRKQMAAAVLAAAALSLSLPLSQAQDTPSPDHMLGLTAEQRMEDYKYLWSVLADSYPCWGILDREGVDVEGIYTSYRDMVAESDSDQTFYQGPGAAGPRCWRRESAGVAGEWGVIC